MTAGAVQNWEEDVIVIESSDEESGDSNDYSPKNLLKYEFNLLFSLRGLKTIADLPKDFCFKAAASCIHGAEAFKIFIENKEKEVERKKKELASFLDLPYELRCSETARLNAETHFFKICERIFRAENEEMYSDKDFQWFVECFKQLPGSERLYDNRKKKYIEEIAPHAHIDKLPDPTAKLSVTNVTAITETTVTVKEEPETELPDLNMNS
ncbi:unnamed protein product [Oikopleura dioica]|uniref:Uncharacterized protein n=1 Tax=Oikopleura dioica TaxID=34765 RepID=E4Y5E8_OIKDI|nr:unnamed protein product [Oikopleura dioica]